MKIVPAFPRFCRARRGGFWLRHSQTVNRTGWTDWADSETYGAFLSFRTLRGDR
jgi:hypothetical protein